MRSFLLAGTRSIAETTNFAKPLHLSFKLPISVQLLFISRLQVALLATRGQSNNAIKKEEKKGQKSNLLKARKREHGKRKKG